MKKANFKETVDNYLFIVREYPIARLAFVVLVFGLLGNVFVWLYPILFKDSVEQFRTLVQAYLTAQVAIIVLVSSLALCMMIWLVPILVKR